MTRDLPRVLVVGGTGLIGRAVAGRFAASGHDVTVLARQVGENLPGVRYRCGDLTDSRTVRRAAAAADHVVLADAGSSPADAELGRIGVGESCLVPLLAELTLPVAVTYLSSGGCVYGESTGAPAHEAQPCLPVSAYGRAKLAGEATVLQTAGISARVLRVSNVYGPGQQARGGQGLIAALLAAVHHGRPVPVFGPRTMTRDYVHADDVAAAVVRLSALPAAPSVVNVGTGVGCTVAEVIAAVGQVTGTVPQVTARPARPFDVHGSVLDVRRLQDLIGWSPAPLLEGLERTWRWASAALPGRPAA